MLSKIQSYFIDDNRVVKSAVGLETHDLKNYDDENYLQNFQNYIDLVKKVSPNTKVIFLYIPDSYNVHIKDRARWSHQNIDFEKSLEGYSKNINILSKKYNIIDTLPVLSDVSKSERLYHYIDTHFNELGNKITSDIFKNYCNKNKCFE